MVRPNEIPQALGRTLGRRKPARKSGRRLSPASLTAERRAVLQQGRDHEGRPGRPGILPKVGEIRRERGEGHAGQELDRFVGRPPQEHVQLQSGGMPLFGLLDDLISQTGLFGPCPQDVGVGGGARPVFRLKVGQEGVEPGLGSSQGLGRAPGEGRLPIGLLHPGRDDELGLARARPGPGLPPDGRSLSLESACPGIRRPARSRG